ncbi:DUF4244 domain-containing protein [Psychromicrobium xiongbiense]|uniref:DUF4244 domain-containing protein n=1 Tax=Psychromicrobium xiongbiense TaxID=3051184 RepID=UPI0025543437|nr:DUF4244 domain-containing protein [Psychromicrobium sp. YIM S02556]
MFTDTLDRQAPVPQDSSVSTEQPQAVEPPGQAVTARRMPPIERYGEWGMATAEYAIATLAAVGFAGLLVVILRSDEVRGFLMNIIRSALSLG